MRTLAILFLLSALVAMGQPIQTVDTIAILAARTPIANSTDIVAVKGYMRVGDWGGPRMFRYDSTNTLAISSVRLPVATGIGRWVHDWDGDVRAFGAIPDGVTVCNTAISNAWAFRGNVHLPEGRYLIDCSHTLNDYGEPVGLFLNPPTDLASRLQSVRLTGDGMYRTTLVLTNVGIGIQIGGAVYATNLGPSLYNVEVAKMAIEGDRTNVQTALRINHATFNSIIDDLIVRGVKTSDTSYAVVLNECWNLHTKHLSIWGDFVTQNGVTITNANQMQFDWLFTQTFSTEGTNGIGFKATNPDGLRINNCQIANKSAYGIVLQASGAAGNDGPTHIYGYTEGPMVFLKTERTDDADADQFIDNLYVHMSGHAGGGPNEVPRGLAWMTNNFRHCIWLDAARNVTLDNSHYNTRNEDFSTIVSNYTGGLITSWINTNYCIKIEPTCTNVRIGHSEYDHTSTSFWVKDEQLRPNSQPDSHMLFEKHVVGTNYVGNVGTSGAMTAQTVDAYPFNRQASQWELVRAPRAVELQVQGTITVVSTNSATLGVVDSGCLNVWTGTPYILSSNPGIRRWLSFPMTPNIKAGTVVRGTVMAPVSNDGKWMWQATNPTNWSSTWVLTPIGVVY